MKLKKVISTVLALGLIASSMTMVAYAETKPSVTVEKVKYEAVAGNKAYDLFLASMGTAVPEGDSDTLGAGIWVPTGCTAYLVTFTLEDVNLARYNFGTNANTRFMGMQALLNYNTSNVEFIAPFNYITGMVDTASESANTSVDGVYKIVTSPNTAGLYLTTQGQTATTVPDVLGIWVVLKDDSKAVTFTPMARLDMSHAGLADELTSVKLNTFSGPTAGTDTPYYLEDSAMSIESFTLGTAAPTEPTITNGTGYACDEAKGKVWAGAKIENITLADYYEVKFTDNTNALAPETKVGKLDFGTKELTGTVTFDIILNTERTLENIVMDIIAKNN